MQQQVFQSVVTASENSLLDIVWYLWPATIIWLRMSLLNEATPGANASHQVGCCQTMTRLLNESSANRRWQEIYWSESQNATGLTIKMNGLSVLSEQFSQL